MYIGDTARLEVVGTDSTISWSIANSAIATVDSEGVVTGISSGKTVVTATVDEQSLTIAVLIW